MIPLLSASESNLIRDIMADSEESKSMEAEHDSNSDGISELRWTARRMEASDDDGDDEEVLDRVEEVKGKHRWSSVDILDDESVGLDGASEYDEEGLQELEEVSQEEGELQETVHVNKEKEKKAVSDEAFVPASGWFYMHDDRIRNRCYGRHKGTMTGTKLRDCTDEQKWKHDKFEETTKQDKSAPRSYLQQQRNNRNKDRRYTDTNQFGSHDNLGNQNKISRIVRGRGPVKYKPIVKSNNLNPSSKHQIPAKLKESASSSSSQRVSSRALAISSDSCCPRMQPLISSMDCYLPVSNSMTSSHDIFTTRRSNKQYGRNNKCIPTYAQKDDKQPVSLPNILLQRETVSNFSGSHGVNIEDSAQLINQITYQPNLGTSISPLADTNAL